MGGAKDIRIGKCPHGGEGEILYRIDEDGDIYARCNLAYYFERAYGKSRMWSYGANSQINKKKKNKGCPVPSENRTDICPYTGGRWVKE